MIVPGLKKGAFIVGAKYGKGFVSCRKGNGPGWSAPGSIRVEGGSFGLQIGGSETDVFMLVMNKKGMDRLLSTKFTLGGDASAAAGPVGRSTQAETDAAMTAEILTWSRSRGLFAGISLSGATLREDADWNTELYGRSHHESRSDHHGRRRARGGERLHRRIEQVFEPQVNMGDQEVSAQMREDWNARAREDAGYYVAFGRRDPDDAEFFATATEVINGLEWELRRVPLEKRGDWRALEIGCGPGRLMRPMSRHFVEIHGVDVSDEMIALAKEKLRDIPNAFPHVSNGSSLAEFADESFDFVYSYAVFQHIPSRDVVFEYLRETHRVMKNRRARAIPVQWADAERCRCRHLGRRAIFLQRHSGIRAPA